MKFRIFVEDERTPEWHEEYDKGNISSLDEAKQWANETIAQFNRTLRPHERERILVRVELMGGEGKVGDEHDWGKTNLVTLKNKYFGTYDAMKCRKCGITGRRPGLGPRILKDREYKARGYSSCRQAIVLLERRKKRREHLAKG